MPIRPALALTLLLAAVPLLAPMGLAQTGGVRFGGLRQDPSLPVEVTAESLTVSQADGSATYEGNVVVGQGEMRLAAATVVVEFDGPQRRIARLRASGGVTLATGTDAAEAREAVYTIDEGRIVLEGDVLLTQGGTAISGDRLVIDLAAGTGSIEGGVETVFTPGGN